MNDDDLRIGDAERERAAAELGEAYAQGRLTPEEHGERLDRIWASRTRGELGPIFADLPSSFGPPVVSTPRTPRGYWSGRPSYRRGFPPPLLLVLLVLIVLTVTTHVPFILAGVLVWFFVGARHRRRHWSTR
jgi:hypothetical protein